MLLVMLRVKKMHMGMKQTNAITRNSGKMFSRYQQKKNKLKGTVSQDGG
jgi:hypothetical protein